MDLLIVQISSNGFKSTSLYYWNIKQIIYGVIISCKFGRVTPCLPMSRIIYKPKQVGAVRIWLFIFEDDQRKNDAWISVHVENETGFSAFE